MQMTRYQEVMLMIFSYKQTSYKQTSRLYFNTDEVSDLKLQLSDNKDDEKAYFLRKWP